MSLATPPPAITKTAFIIIPVHNRKATTLQCLAHLAQQGDLDAYSVVVVDDGSTDGTAAAVAAKYPSVTLLHGDGNLWWTGATHKGMDYAYHLGAEYFIWLNDDTLPQPGAIASLIAQCALNAPCAIAAQCYADEQFLQPTYGGQRRHRLSLEAVISPIGQTLDCTCLNGNLTCIPRTAIDSIGFLEHKKFPHYHGETIYTWRLKQSGFKVLVTDQTRAICGKNPGDTSWLTSDEPVLALWQRLATPKSPFYVPAFWHFCLSLWGPVGILVFVKPYARLSLISVLKWTFPKTLLRQLKAARP